MKECKLKTLELAAKRWRHSSGFKDSGQRRKNL